MRQLCLAFFFFLAFSLMGCSSHQPLKDSWKFTTRQYRTYLNTPASLDMENKGSCEAYELALGEAVLNVDQELLTLLRIMENSDHNPDQAWVMNVMQRLPWLSGVALVEEDGTIVSRYPEYSTKPLDPAPLLKADPKQRMGDVRAYAQMTPEGSVLYVANPVYGDGFLRGLIVAHFDPRALVTMSSDPGSFMLVSPAGIVWAGNYEAQAPLVVAEDWEQLLRKKSCGLIGEKGKEFFWTTRYIGNLPLAYVRPTNEAALPKTTTGKPSTPRFQPVTDTPDVPLSSPSGESSVPHSPSGMNTKPASQ